MSNRIAALALALAASAAFAGTAELRVVVSPHTFQVDTTDDVVLAITNVTPGPGAPLFDGDTFDLHFDLRGGSLA
jgi:hypothetical protein